MRNLTSMTLAFLLGISLTFAPACGKGEEGKAPAKTGSKTEPKPNAKAVKTPTEVKVPKVAELKVHDAASLKAAVKSADAKATLIAVWATWCAPCIAEMPALAAFYDAHKKDGLNVIGLCVDDKAELGKKIQEVMDKVKVPFEMALLKPETDEAFFKALGIEWDNGLPASIVLGADGSKKLYTRKALTEEFLKASVLPLLK